MKIYLIAATVLALAVGACSQLDRTVKGFQTGPGGWQMAASSRTEMTSNVEYLGASADGMIIVRMQDGSAQIWRSSR